MIKTSSDDLRNSPNFVRDPRTVPLFRRLRTRIGAVPCLATTSAWLSVALGPVSPPGWLPLNPYHVSVVMSVLSQPFVPLTDFRRQNIAPRESVCDVGYPKPVIGPEASCWMSRPSGHQNTDFPYALDWMVWNPADVSTSGAVTSFNPTSIVA